MDTKTHTTEVATGYVPHDLRVISVDPWSNGKDANVYIGYGPTCDLTGGPRYFLANFGNKAAARLFLAAPKMLEALKNLENDDGKAMPATAWAMVQDAIREAEEGELEQ